MKRPLIAIAVLLLAAFTACKKASGPANGNSVQLNNKLDTLVSMTSIINRINWQADSVFGYLVRQAGRDSGITSLIVSASYMNTNGVSSTIAFNIYNFTGPNTYVVNPPLISATYYLGSTRHLATTGEIIITENTPYGLIGNFNFAADTFVVVDGIFNTAQP
jgi:hypothetical protein